MADHVSVTTEIAAPVDKVWDLVSDLTRMHEWSPENDTVTWLKGATGSVPGATFKGTNKSGKKEWATKVTRTISAPIEVWPFADTAGG